MPKHNWRATPPGQHWCSDCEDFRPVDMFTTLTSGLLDNYCTFHRKKRRLASKHKYHPPQKHTCPKCGHQF
jgi:hypothetical protein